MTSYITITRHEHIGNRWMIWGNVRGTERVWLYADDPASYPIGKTFQI